MKLSACSLQVQINSLSKLVRTCLRSRPRTSVKQGLPAVVVRLGERSRLSLAALLPVICDQRKSARLHPGPLWVPAGAATTSRGPRFQASTEAVNRRPRCPSAVRVRGEGPALYCQAAPGQLLPNRTNLLCSELARHMSAVSRHPGQPLIACGSNASCWPSPPGTAPEHTGEEA